MIKTKSALCKLIEVQGKEHFVTKITGDLRLSVLNKLFTNYKIIWIERDPRVVVSSYIKQRWFYKDKVEEFNKMTMNDKIRFYSKFYLKHYHNALNVNKKLVFYEDLCENPIQFFEDLLNTMNLEFTEWHKTKIRSHNITKVNWSHYEKNYKENEIQLLQALLKQPLEDYNYI